MNLLQNFDFAVIEYLYFVGRSRTRFMQLVLNWP